MSGAVILLDAAPAWANVGLPMLAIAWPAMVIGFVPIFLIEAVVARRLLRAPGSALAVLVANLASTLAGIPLTWVAIVALAMLTGGILSLFPDAIWSSPIRWVMAPFAIAWLGPGVERYPTLIPGAFLGLLIPFFFASIWLERRVVEWFDRWPKDAVASWSWQANLLSYTAIAVLALGSLLWTIVW